MEIHKPEHTNSVQLFSKITFAYKSDNTLLPLRWVVACKLWPHPKLNERKYIPLIITAIELLLGLKRTMFVKFIEKENEFMEGKKWVNTLLRRTFLVYTYFSSILKSNTQLRWTFLVYIYFSSILKRKVLNSTY